MRTEWLCHHSSLPTTVSVNLFSAIAAKCLRLLRRTLFQAGHLDRRFIQLGKCVNIFGVAASRLPSVISRKKAILLILQGIVFHCKPCSYANS